MKKVLVMGATGAQGGSVVDALLKDGKWEVYGLTRNTGSEAAKQLARKGVHVVPGNVKNENDLRSAMNGMYGVYAVTNFWDPEIWLQEAEIGKKIVDIAKEQKIQHFIWSTLPNTDKITGGKINVPHLTLKALVEDYALEQGLFCTFLSLGFYYQNFQTFFPPKKEPDGTLVFSLPMPESAFIPGADVRDTGAGVLAALNHPDQWKNAKIDLIGEISHPTDFVNTFQKVTKLKAKYQPLDVEAGLRSKDPVEHEMALMFAYFNMDPYRGGTDKLVGRKAVPNPRTFEQWLRETGWQGQPAEKKQG